jgi:aminoglycoside phosphotransferase (APT) family kinase protein
MATIGHPLSDLVNLLGPYITAHSKQALSAGRSNTAFQEGALAGLPTKQQCLQWYTEDAGWDPKPDLVWGEAFSIYRGTIIMQGIAARHALRIASSARAMEYGDAMKPYAEVAWQLIQEFEASHSRSRL